MLIVVFEHSYLTYGSKICGIEDDFRKASFRIRRAWGNNVDVKDTGRTILYVGTLVILEDYDIRKDKGLLAKMAGSEAFYLLRVQSASEYDTLKIKFTGSKASFIDNHRPNLKSLFADITQKLPFMDDKSLEYLWRRSGYDYYRFFEYVILCENAGYYNLEMLKLLPPNDPMGFFTFATSILFIEISSNQHKLVKYLYNNRNNKKLIPRLKQYYADIQAVQDYMMVNSSYSAEEIKDVLPNSSEYSREQCAQIILETSNEYLGFCLARMSKVLEKESIYNILKLIERKD